MKRNLPPELTAQLTRMIRRVRGILLMRGVLAVLAVATGAVLTVMAVDAAVVLYHPAARWGFSCAGLALVAATAWSMLVVPLSRPLTLTRMARVLETRHPDMQERISSAIELAEHGGGAEAARASAELIALLTQDAKSELAGVQARQEFTVRTVKPFLLAAACVALVLAGLFAVWPKQSWLLFLRALAPHRAFDTLQASVLEVKPGDIMQLAGTPLRFEVTAPERHGLRAEIHFQREGGRKAVERMRRLSAQGADPVVFGLEIPSVEEGFEYRVRYGNGYTRPYTVAVMTAPAVVETRVTYTYPAYTGLAATQQVGVAQSIAAVAGTRVRIEGTFDRACAAALRINALTLMNPAGAATNGVWLQALSTNRTGRWALTLRDACGFTNRVEWAGYIALPDQPPEVVLALPEASKLTVPPYDRVVFSGTAADDYGFGAMQAVIRAEKLGERVLPLRRTGGSRTQAELEAAPDLKALYDQGCRSFKLCFRVADNLPPELGGPQVRESRAVTVSLDMGARTLREQVREAARKALEEQLRKTAQQLHEAANRVAEEKWTLDKQELPEKTVQKLDQSREHALRAEEMMERAAQATAKTPFESFAKDILDVRDEKVEPAFRKLEQIPLTAADKRKQVGEETEQAFRQAAEKVNDLLGRVLQEENRRQEERSRLDELAQREKALAEQAEAAKMNKQEMQEWANRQNEAEQRLWQSKPQLQEEAFNKALENLRQAREQMLQAEREATGEQDQALRREQEAAKTAEKAAELAEQAAEKALEAAEKAEDVAETRAASDAVRQAAEKTEAAAEKAARAADEARQAAEKRAANEAAGAVAEKKAVAEQALKAAEQAEKAAEEAALGAEYARQAAEAQAAGDKEKAQKDERSADAKAEGAQAQARQANAEAVEAARQAEEQGMEKAAEAGQLATESAAHTQRAAELARQAAEQSKASEALAEEPRQAAANEARGLAAQAKQVAEEAREKAEQAMQRAKEQLAQLAQAEQAAAERQSPTEAVKAQAQAAAEAAREAVGQAQEAVKAAREAVAQAAEATPLNRAMAEQMAEAAAMAEQAGELAGQSAERTQAAEAAELGEAQERAETRQAMAEAQAAAALAAEAARMAKATAQTAAGTMAELKAATAEAAEAAERQAQAAARQAEQAAKQAQAAPEALREAAARSGEAARLTQEAAGLARQAVETSARAEAAADERAAGEARQGQERAKEALALARQAREQAAARQAAEARQLEAAAKAQQLAEAMALAVEEQARKDAESWAQVQARLGGSEARRMAAGGAGGPERTRRVPLNQDWIRFRGEMGSEAYEEMLKKTPAEYRELVKQYFEELSREGQPGGN